MKRTVVDIKKLIGPKKCRVIGDVKRKFSSARPIHKALSGDLTFCVKKGKEAVPLLERTESSVVICDVDVPCQNVRTDDKTLVAVSRPRLWFIRCINAFFPREEKTGIHPTAVIGKNCQIGKNVYIGPYSSIGDDVVIGTGTKIHSGVHIYDRVRIGKNVILQSGCIIGSDGFGYERNEEGVYERFTHIGGVIIEDHVEIGANTCVDRGTLSDTVIGEGTKVDNLVHIGHNCLIGRNCIITAMVCIGGRVELEDGVWLGVHSIVVKEGVKVKRRALVGIGALVLKDVGEEDVVAGIPARFLRKRRENE